MVTRNELLRVLRDRCDGYWELVATSAGRMDSVQRTMDGLAAKALDLHFEGPAVSPSLVQQRVEALAAFDAKLLHEVSRDWKPPERVSLNLMDDAADFWSCAWSSAMRFLTKRDASIRRSSRPVPHQIELEQNVLLGATATIQSFEELLAFATNDSNGYSEYRQLDRGTVELEGPLSRRQLVELLGGSEQPDDSDLERLRLLLPRLRLVEGDGRSWLEKLLRELWLTLQEPPVRSGGLLVLLNVVLDLRAAKDPPDDITEHFIHVLRQRPEPAAWAPFAYLLVRQGWEVP